MVSFILHTSLAIYVSSLTSGGNTALSLSYTSAVKGIMFKANIDAQSYLSSSTVSNFRWRKVETVHYKLPNKGTYLAYGLCRYGLCKQLVKYMYCEGFTS